MLHALKITKKEISSWNKYRRPFPNFYQFCGSVEFKLNDEEKSYENISSSSLNKPIVHVHNTLCTLCHPLVLFALSFANIASSDKKMDLSCIRPKTTMEINITNYNIVFGKRTPSPFGINSVYQLLLGIATIFCEDKPLGFCWGKFI